jgi:hypothetical protein
MSKLAVPSLLNSRPLEHKEDPGRRMVARAVETGTVNQGL